VTDAGDFWGLFRRMRDDLIKRIPTVQTATVVGLTIDGEPILQFDGDALPSKKTYERYASYIPEAGDRVQILNGVIQGGWKS